jgi:tetratricopeptide (TPR) repeat protein
MRIVAPLSMVVFSMALIASPTAVSAKSSPQVNAAAALCFGKVKATWPRIILACTKVLEAKPAPGYRAGAHYNRGAAYLKVGGAQNALNDFTEALKIKPNFVQALEARGGVLVGQLKFDLALVDLNKAISLNPKSATAYNNRGMAHLAKKDVTQALADFSKTIELEPSKPDGYISRANAHIGNKDRASAMADLNKAIQLDPKHVVALANRAQLYVADGAKDKAMADLKAILAVQPNNKIAKDELAALSKG